MWLLEGFKAPDHNTIARFRTGRLEPILDDLFNQFIVKLYENNELELKNLFIDGTKIETNANKYTFMWEKSVSKNEINYFINLLNLYENRKIPFSSVIVAIQIYAIRFDDKDLLNQTFFNPYPIELISIADSGKGRNL